MAKKLNPTDEQADYPGQHNELVDEVNDNAAHRKKFSTNTPAVGAGWVWDGSNWVPRDDRTAMVPIGPDSTVARPNAEMVYWVGTVEPDNAVLDDRLHRPDLNEDFRHDGTSFVRIFSGTFRLHGNTYDLREWTGTGNWTGTAGDEITQALQAAHDETDPGDEIIIPTFATDGLGCGKVSIIEPKTIRGSSHFGARLIGTGLSAGEYMLDVVRDGTNGVIQGNHLYGVVLANLFLDGNGRTQDGGGMHWDVVDHSTVWNLRIAHWQREAWWLNRSCRESSFYQVYLYACGDAERGYAQLRVKDSEAHTDGSGGANNLHFYGLKSVYPLGDNVLVGSGDQGSGSTTRQIHFIGAMLHNIAESQTTIPGRDGYGDYTVDRWVRSCRPFVNDGATGVHVNGYNIPTAPAGQPMALVVDTNSRGGSLFWGEGSSTVPDSRTVTVSSVDTTNDWLTTSAEHLFTREAVVRVDSDADDPPGGLSEDTDYYVVLPSGADDDGFNLRLAASRTDAEAGTYVDLTSAGSGTITVVAQEISILREDVSVNLDVLSGAGFGGLPNRAAVVTRGTDASRCKVGFPLRRNGGVTTADVEGPHEPGPLFGVLPIPMAPESWGLGLVGSASHGIYQNPAGAAKYRSSLVLPTDGASNHDVYRPVSIHPQTPQWKARVHWANPTTNTGDVVLSLFITDPVADEDGDDLSTEGQANLIQNEAITDPAKDVRQVTESAASSLTGLRSMRLMTTSASTLGADIHVIDVEIVEA